MFEVKPEGGLFQVVSKKNGLVFAECGTERAAIETMRTANRAVIMNRQPRS